jgi:hypothetical protein
MLTVKGRPSLCDAGSHRPRTLETTMPATTLPRTPALLLLAAGCLVACGDDTSGTGGGGGSTSTSTGATGTSSTTATSTTGGTTTGSTTGTASTTSTTTGSGGDGGGTGGSTSSVGGGSAAFPDDCAVAGDCPGGDCVEVGAGFYACRYRVEEATACTGKLDECCTTEDCGVGGGTCVTLPDASYCGGAKPQSYNACTGNAGCIDCGKGGGGCLDAGFYGYEIGQCVPQGCFSDSDCGDEAGGRCAPIHDPCCGAIVGFFCAYPSDGCRRDSDCGNDQHCEVDFEAGRATCVAGMAQCPG